MGRREFGCRTRTGPGGTQPQRVQQPLQRRHSNAPPPLIGLSNPEIRKNGVQQPASRLTTPPTPSIPCEKPVPEGVCVCVWDEADWRGWFSGEGGFPGRVVFMPGGERTTTKPIGRPTALVIHQFGRAAYRSRFHYSATASLPSAQLTFRANSNAKLQTQLETCWFVFFFTLCASGCVRGCRSWPSSPLLIEKSNSANHVRIIERLVPNGPLHFR